MKPIILGIETATDACSVALNTERGIINRFAIEPQAHSKLLLGMVDELCNEAGIKLEQIDAFAFGKGPGSFTGLRIAASVIQGLAFGCEKPVIAVSTLQALAQQAKNSLQVDHVLALIDARMQEVYWGKYSARADGLVRNESADCLQNPEFLTFENTANCVAVGTGCMAYATILQTNNQQLTLNTTILYPRAQEIVQIALAEYAVNNLTPASQAVPVYIRNDVAKKSKKNPD